MLWRIPLLVCMALQWVAAEQSPADVCVCDCSRCSQDNNKGGETATTRYGAPTKHSIRVRSGPRNPQLREARRQNQLSSRASTKFRDYSHQPGNGRGADVDGLVSNYQGGYSGNAGSEQNQIHVKASSNAKEEDGRDFDFNSLIERLAAEISRSLEAENSAMKKDGVSNERLRNARMLLATFSAVKRQESAFAQLGKLPAGVASVAERIKNSVLRNKQRTGHGPEQSSMEKAVQSVTDFMKTIMTMF